MSNKKLDADADMPSASPDSGFSNPLQHSIDISEDDLLTFLSGQAATAGQPATVLDTLLHDHTTDKNIFWATHDYEALGPEYGYHSEILPHLITGEHRMVIRPRVLKSKEEQTDRAKDMAEVFTPSWICNAQNNLVDEAWFGRKQVFNAENDEQHTWLTNPERIEFPDGKTWKDYVRLTRMEITCGEAPYLVSRYDTTTGRPIPLEQRIGLLDRKLRVVSENTGTTGEWIDWAQTAYQNIYGYEWQGDNLLLAREALLWTFIEYYQAKFGKAPLVKSVNYIAYIISWNLWQMDGLKGVVPDSCDAVFEPAGLFDAEPRRKECAACRTGALKGHIGQRCIIRDWRKPRNQQKTAYVSLIK